MGDHYPDEWDDLPVMLRKRLELDMFDYGVAYYEETADGYERINPLDAAPDRAPDVGHRSDEVFGTSPVAAVATAVTVRDRINQRLGIDR